MIELRCENNRKLAELDPATLRLLYWCRTCHTAHAVTLAELLDAIAKGQTCGVLRVAG